MTLARHDERINSGLFGAVRRLDKHDKRGDRSDSCQQLAYPSVGAASAKRDRSSQFQRPQMTQPDIIVWCMDSPGFGGSEINLMRVVGFVRASRNVLVHGPVLAQQIREWATAMGVETREAPIGSGTRDLLRVARGAIGVIREFRRAPFVVWGHHTDSNRWLNLALATSGRRYAICEQLIPSSRSDFANSRLSIPLKRWTSKSAQAVILNAESQASQYRKVLGIAARNLQVIVNSRPVAAIFGRVHELRIDRVGLRSSLGLPAGDLLVCVGRLAEQKDQASLIQSIGLLGSTAPTLVLVGDGADHAELDRLAATLTTGRVIFAGHQANPLPWLAAADAFVLPSLAEGLPGALIEAMAAGLPCIATDIPGNRELVRNGKTGLTVPVRSPEQLAAAIKLLFAKQAEAARLASAGYEHVLAHYDEAAERIAWRRLIRQLASG